MTTFTVDIGNCALALIAAFGLSAYKREQWWRHRYDLATKIKVAIFRFRDEISDARIGIPQGRLEAWCKRYSEASAGLEAIALEGEAVWGHDLRTALNKLYAVGNEFCRSYGRMRAIDKQGNPINANNEDEYLKLMPVVNGSDDSEFGKKLKKAVEQVVAIIAPPGAAKGVIQTGIIIAVLLVMSHALFVVWHASAHQSDNVKALTENVDRLHMAEAELRDMQSTREELDTAFFGFGGFIADNDGYTKDAIAAKKKAVDLMKGPATRE